MLLEVKIKSCVTLRLVITGTFLLVHSHLQAQKPSKNLCKMSHVRLGPKSKVSRIN